MTATTITSVLKEIGPLFTALLFLFVYPYPAKWVYEFSRKRQKDLRDIRQKIEEETLLSVEESREIRRAMSKQRLEYEQEIRRQADDIETLKSAVAATDEENDKLRTDLEASKNRKEELEDELKEMRSHYDLAKALEGQA